MKIKKKKKKQITKFRRSDPSTHGINYTQIMLTDLTCTAVILIHKMFFNAMFTVHVFHTYNSV